MATILYAIAIKEFGEEALHSWEPETISMEMNEAFGDMPTANHDKLLALIASVESNVFYTSWSAFEIACRTINTGELYGSDELLVAEMAWGVAEVLLNDDTPSKFSDEVAAGVGKVLFDEGIMEAPPSLSFAKIPGQYEGSYTEGDLGKQQTLSGEHLAVVIEYVTEQSILLLKQICALPWHTEESMVEMVEQMASL
jgi:hypothetical protein